MNGDINSKTVALEHGTTIKFSVLKKYMCMVTKKTLFFIFFQLLVYLCRSESISYLMAPKWRSPFLAARKQILMMMQKKVIPKHSQVCCTFVCISIDSFIWTIIKETSSYYIQSKILTLRAYFPEVTGKYLPKTWTLREDFHLEPEISSERQYFASCIIWCDLYGV